MNQFKAFMEQLQDMEYELDKKLKDFTPSDFLELEDELDDKAFKDPKVIAKIKECGAVLEIKKDAKTGGTFIKLANGKEGIFGI
ncbi:MAG: hypothetical protein ACRDDX_01345 [Cellulosilyticaceae bacterium]